MECTEVRFASFLSGGFITVIVVNPPEKKLAKCISVYWFACLYPLITYLNQVTYNKHFLLDINLYFFTANTWMLQYSWCYTYLISCYYFWNKENNWKSATHSLVEENRIIQTCQKRKETKRFNICYVQRIYQSHFWIKFSVIPLKNLQVLYQCFDSSNFCPLLISI